MSARVVRLTVALALALPLGACRHETGLSRPPAGRRAPAPGELELRRKLDKDTGRVVREWSVLVYGDRPPQKHGRETIWSPAGTKLSEREFVEGEPFGAWRAWYADGTPKSESFFDAGGGDTTMTFWHPNGALSMRGPARNGVRRGEWTVWYANGRIAEQGHFSGSLREGRWIAWSKDGSQRFERRYAKNVRVSEEALAPEDAAPAPAPRARKAAGEDDEGRAEPTPE